MANASICAENNVNGLALFKEKYVQPKLQLSIDNLKLILTGARKDFYPLVPFLEDEHFFGSSSDGHGNYTLDVDSTAVVKETVADFKGLVPNMGLVFRYHVTAARLHFSV